ncbi:Beta-hexosaminidase [Dactylellina cionopaga]|nr:Beta-hexosaminidase [Dactylellina cionopaga]
MLIIPLDSPDADPYVLHMIRAHYIGGVLLSRRSIRHSVDVRRLVHELQQTARGVGYAQPLFIAIEQENGMSALELQSMNINLNLAPVLNIEESNSGIMSSRTFGDDPINAWRCASAITDAHRRVGMGCFVKHFPAPRQGSGILETRNVTTEPRYAPFKKAFEHKVDGVLLEPTMWATSTEQTFEGKDSFVENLIRKHFGYDGVLIGSCDRASEKVAGTFGGQLCIRGFVNGCDMMIICEHPTDIQDTLEEIYTAVDMRRISKAAIEKSVERVRKVKERYLSWETALNPPQIQLSLPALMGHNKELAFRAYEMAVTVVRNSAGIIPLSKPRRASILRKSGSCTLLTPVVPPRYPGPTSQDPFEYLGRALNAREIYVSHAPYTHEGLTETHLGLIKQASLVIFVVALDTDPEYRAQIETLKAVARTRPDGALIVISACSPRELLPELHVMDTLVCCYEYTKGALESAASAIFGEITPTGSLPFYRKSIPGQSLQPGRRWEVHQWEKRRDLYASTDLWKKCFDWNEKWKLNSATLSDLLDRPYQSKHFVVKDPRAHGRILGLCATYTIRAGKNTVGSMAMVMVDPDFRNQGIGLALHDQAFQYMRSTGLIESVQLGSIFPRFFPGLPEELPVADQDWFLRRGWTMENSYIYDLYQDIENWQVPSTVFSDLGSQGITFGRCDQTVFDDLIQFEDKHFSTYPGWVEKYRALKDTDDYVDAVLAFGGNSVVGAALVFSGVGSNQISKDVPWPKAIGDRVGGLACVGMGPEYRGRGVGRGLVCAAIMELQNRGLKGCFVDWSTDRQVYEELGFKTYGKYRNMTWRKI